MTITTAQGLHLLYFSPIDKPVSNAKGHSFQRRERSHSRWVGARQSLLPETEMCAFKPHQRSTPIATPSSSSPKLQLESLQYIRCCSRPARQPAKPFISQEKGSRGMSQAATAVVVD
eukprot:3316253-Rhodomonas_salina.3